MTDASPKIETFTEAAKAKIVRLTADIADIEANLSALAAQMAALREAGDIAKASLATHSAALAALDGIMPELKVALNALVEGKS
jgi:formate dehydrogenase assembly factor FdhD